MPDTTAPLAKPPGLRALTFFVLLGFRALTLSMPANMLAAFRRSVADMADGAHGAKPMPWKNANGDLEKASALWRQVFEEQQ